MVVGAHGIVGYRSEPRATQDVDILVRKRDHRKAIAAIRKAYPKLRMVDSPVVTRFIDDRAGKVVIDLMRPAFRIYQLAFRHRVWVKDEYCIPSLEMALVAKFAAMTAPNRPERKRLVDAGDFRDIVEFNLDSIDRYRLRRLGNRARTSGGMRILSLIDDIKAGRRMGFDALGEL
jgi:hypothetical protein